MPDPIMTTNDHYQPITNNHPALKLILSMTGISLKVIIEIPCRYLNQLTVFEIICHYEYSPSNIQFDLNRAEGNINSLVLCYGV